MAQGRFAIGLSIDFLGRNETGALDFAYPTENVFLPANIAVLSQARNPDGARRFAAFVLSEVGQALLSEPRVNRFAIGAGVRAAGVEDLFALARAERPPFRFDATLSGHRYELVNILFDELITERLARLQKFWRLHSQLEPQLAGNPSLLAEWRGIGVSAIQWPAALKDLEHDPAVAHLKRVPRGVPLEPAQTALVERIRQAAEASLSSAEARLEMIQRRIGPADLSAPVIRP